MLETSLVAPATRTRGDRIVDWFKSRERPLLVAGAMAQVVVLVGMIALPLGSLFRRQDRVAEGAAGRPARHVSR